MLTSSSNTKEDSQTQQEDPVKDGGARSGVDKPASDYYYDDATGYEVYREEDENDADETHEEDDQDLRAVPI